MIRILGLKTDASGAREPLLSALPTQWRDVWQERHGAVKNEQSAVRSLAALCLLYRLHPAGTLAYTALGKPYFAEGDADVGITHTHGMVLCAIAPFPIGLDAEHLARAHALSWRALAARWLTTAEREAVVDAEGFLRVWTRKEAMVKQSGEGMRGFPSADSVAAKESGEWQFYERREGDVLLTLCYRATHAVPVAFQLLGGL